MTRATDLSIQASAFLDALAVGESGGADDDEAYTIYFGGSHFEAPPWPTGFPAWGGQRVNGWMTHAAGRYQFEPATWQMQQQKLHLPDFTPQSQDHAAWDLAAEVYHARTGGDLAAKLASGDLGDVATRLHSTWTSLSEETLAERYEAALRPAGESPEGLDARPTSGAP
jgi:muramidase (phage lysozyme)